ncbi:sulfite exporter TauE/SafE family protein [Halostagnicola sp. A-GB9-2]|uniref:sulfite exporter TauE/SafE family protein n=1 Tax=Halostagnicola sp. A-GB9-2 TaxID=3048066 RepID=UPI0024BF61FF|nr:sulfite exporter TauE/SafE family protein [Halostagnicola sp. A-GB9-2]MDJ1433186.1 sulfite exporter TauE/SafE family protein [Halostagnicola sp. A-GB9-2]
MVFTTMSITVLVALAIIALFAGIGITTIGPGGIFVTIALYSLTPLPSATVAGTAHATFIATGIVGTLAYIRSGELGGDDGRQMAVVLSATSIVGALAGAYLNAYVSRELFGLLLGGFAALVGAVLLYRQQNSLDRSVGIDGSPSVGRLELGALGVGLGVSSGLIGVGGPVLAVPALVVIGVPMLLAVGVAQVQSIFIAVFATSGYLSYGAVSLPFVILVGVPQLIGVVVGWRIAHRTDPERLKTVLGGVLILVGVYLAI